MANKSKVETIDNSTVVLNDEAVETPVNDIETVAETNDDTSCPVHSDVDCQCKPGHCPNKACKSGNYWTTAPSTEKYVYHYDSDNEDLKLTDADHRKENPAYVEPTPTPTPDKKDDEDTGSDDCGPEREEPWAHDTLLEDDDEHTGLERELRVHTKANWDIIASWIEDLKAETDADAKAAKVAHIAWHIPTGGPAVIKAHHKELIVAELNKL